jgi:hypothetical protein
MAQGHSDYSSTPLPRKLGIREGARVLLVNPPDGFTQLLSPVPEGVTFVSRASTGLDVVIWFATNRRGLEGGFSRLARRLQPDGRLWLAWPKKASRVPTDIDFHEAQRVGLAEGLVDNKSASLTDVFQGLQFVYRLRDRPLP